MRAEQVAYFDAERCLINAPSKNPASDAATRYDDLVIVHQLNSIGWYVDGTWSVATSLCFYPPALSAMECRTGDLLHKTGRFLPWHRGFTLAHETLLREECGYTGHLPYWNWSCVSYFSSSYCFSGLKMQDSCFFYCMEEWTQATFLLQRS